MQIQDKVEWGLQELGGFRAKICGFLQSAESTLPWIPNRFHPHADQTCRRRKWDERLLIKVISRRAMMITLQMMVIGIILLIRRHAGCLEQTMALQIKGTSSQREGEDEMIKKV